MTRERFDIAIDEAPASETERGKERGVRIAGMRAIEQTPHGASRPLHTNNISPWDHYSARVPYWAS